MRFITQLKVHFNRRNLQTKFTNCLWYVKAFHSRQLFFLFCKVLLHENDAQAHSGQYLLSLIFRNIKYCMGNGAVRLVDFSYWPFNFLNSVRV